jgi:hypothetical protein
MTVSFIPITFRIMAIGIICHTLDKIIINDNTIASFLAQFRNLNMPTDAIIKED